MSYPRTMRRQEFIKKFMPYIERIVETALPEKAKPSDMMKMAMKRLYKRSKVLGGE